MNEFDKKANESHDQKSNPRRLGNLGKFFSIRFGTFLDQMHRILSELLERFDQDFIESFLFHFCDGGGCCGVEKYQVIMSLLVGIAKKKGEQKRRVETSKYNNVV
jgi:hypothetical protein